MLVTENLSIDIQILFVTLLGHIVPLESTIRTTQIGIAVSVATR